ncbi:hypothetical protein DDZ16_10050 [Marinilabilia rubra]|uniref:Uncharacterized protein n=1 Tax=Marinilabilia rubra TaxID=2162893 RepID=A0A2U2B8F5_9BACT|nr:hypothetical protein DDZ16_10050 [Marinilabilia rubra]
MKKICAVRFEAINDHLLNKQKAIPPYEERVRIKVMCPIRAIINQISPNYLSHFTFLPRMDILDRIEP